MKKAWNGHERVKFANTALSRRGPGVTKCKRHEDASSKDITNILNISIKVQLDTCDCW